VVQIHSPRPLYTLKFNNFMLLSLKRLHLVLVAKVVTDWWVDRSQGQSFRTIRDPEHDGVFVSVRLEVMREGIED